MRSCGVRELKEHTSEVLRRVRETGEPIEITVRGRPVARLVPLTDTDDDLEHDLAVFDAMDQLAEEISARWPAGVTAVDAVRDVRRDL